MPQAQKPSKCSNTGQWFDGDSKTRWSALDTVKRSLIWTQLWAMAPLLASCSEVTAPNHTENTVKVSDFKFRECKTSSSRSTLATGRDASDYAGMECVAWTFSNDSQAIDLINRRAGCGFDGNNPEESLWKPELVQTASDTLRLRISWDFEDPSACGYCVHDFSVQAQDVALPADSLNLVIETRSCSGMCEWETDSVVVDLSGDASGIRCRYLDSTDSAYRHATAAGKLGGPSQDGACDDALVATEIDDASRCLEGCSSNNECEQKLMSCASGACVLSDAW